MNLIIVDSIMAVIILLCASVVVLLAFSELQWKLFVASLDSDLFFYSIE